MQTKEFPEVLTVEQARKLLQIGRNKMYEMTHWRGFPAVKIGRHIRIPKKALFEWLEMQKKGGIANV